MTREQQEAARKRCEAATKSDGSWGVFLWSKGLAGRDNIIKTNDSNVLGVAFVERAEDLDFIVHARTDLPAALDEIDRLRGVLQSIVDTYPYTRDAAEGCYDCERCNHDQHECPWTIARNALR
jgi:hypothetical protein